MIIDCDSCQARPAACGDCVVTVLLGPVGGHSPVTLDDDEQRAISALSESGLVPPLRLVPVRPALEEGEVTGGAQHRGAGTYHAHHDPGPARAG